MRIIVTLALSLLCVAPLYGQSIWQYAGLQGIANPIAVRSNGNIFAGASGSMYRSTDNGDSWMKVSNGLPDNLFVSSAAMNPSGHTFIGTGQGIHRSTDNGESWTQISKGLPANLTVWSLGINANGFIFAGTEQGVYRSKNNGESWTPMNRGLANPPADTSAASATEQFSAGDGLYSNITPTKFRNTTFVTFAISPDGSIFAGANDGLYRSANNGKKWRRIGFVDQEISTLAINANGQVFATTSFLGLYSSIDNGDTWTPINDGQTTGHITALIISPNGYIFAGTHDRGIFRSIDNGVNWTPVNDGFTVMRTIYALAISPSGYIFAGTVEGFFRRVLSTILE